MSKEMLLDLSTIDRVKRFVHIVNEFDCEIEVISGRYTLDGKSIMALFSINLLEPLLVRMLTDDVEQIEIFNKTMEEFKYENKSK